MIVVKSTMSGIVFMQSDIAAICGRQHRPQHADVRFSFGIIIIIIIIVSALVSKRVLCAPLVVEISGRPDRFLDDGVVAHPL